jgi:hypothetical protein
MEGNFGIVLVTFLYLGIAARVIIRPYRIPNKGYFKCENKPQ